MAAKLKTQSSKTDRWDVWKVFYMTYAEIKEQGELQRQRVTTGLSFQAAQAKVQELGFGYSMHPNS
jgi:hypothetical protein